MKRNKSWEIILAGLAFIGIGIYLLNSTNTSGTNKKATAWNSNSNSSSSLPGAIVIDLENLESLKNLKKLRNLKDLENLDQLEVELKNIDKLIEEHAQNNIESESLSNRLHQLELELQKIDQTDFNFKVRDQKLFINKNYDIDEEQWEEVNSGEFIYKDSFSASDLRSLDVQIEFGNVTIVGNRAENIEITLQATGDINDPAELTEQLNVDKNFSAGEAQFHLASKNGSSIVNTINLEATLSIPKNLSLKTQTSGGHITANNLHNVQQLHTSGGHITLNNISGETHAKTGGGHITSDTIRGVMNLTTGGGHIKISDFDGSLDAKTGGGHIEIEKAGGSISAKTSGGNISTEIDSLRNQLILTTSAGNISLNIPQSTAAKLDVTGTSVNLDEDFNFIGTKNSGNINGKINDGELPIVIKCGFGNVTISSNS